MAKKPDKKEFKRAKKAQRIDQLANEINDDAGDEAMSRCIANLKRIKVEKGK